jgi:hypothetical protein
MSVELQLLQTPLLITPSNDNHIYNVFSTGYTLNNFQYICDVYFRPQEVDWANQNDTTYRVCRLKILPNSYGNAILDLEEIVRTLLFPNPRFTGNTYPYLNYASDVNKIITLADAQTTIEYNGSNLWPGGSPNASVDQLWHVEEYRAMFGCTYTSGNTQVEQIERLALYQPEPITIFPAVNNKLIPSPYLSAATFNTSGYTSPIGANWFQYPNTNHLYYDLFRHVYQSGTTNTDGSCDYDVESCGPREFFNAAGRHYKTISQPEIVDTRVRTRMHHPDCPIVLTFLNGKTPYFTNDIYSIAIRSSLTSNGDYTYSAEMANRLTTTLPTVPENVDGRFKMGVFYLPYNLTSGNTLNAIPTNSKKVCFYGTTYKSNQDDRLNFSGRTTEILEFMMQDRSCINDEPIHLLFLNSSGMWDTYTFGGKIQKKRSITRPSYRQEPSLNKQFYNLGAYQRGDVIIEQNMELYWECESWYMEQNDVEIINELFMSPQVFIIDGTVIKESSCESCLHELRLYQELIPVIIKDTSWEIWNQHYKKLYQYKITLEYAGFKRERTQG